MAQTTLRDRIQTIEDAISAGQIDDAMAHCQQILARYPDALEIQRLLGEVYLAQGRLEEAQQTFDWILVNDPENVIAYCDRALICEHLSDIDTALDCYQQAYELSRGNSQIRREFNQLSARVGQQEFMLSRAGLARLYMRGDLLTQAIQEWEAVLTAGPDRVDARLGLLETYWREGMYDQAEQIASRILEEIPNCVKALLLLAHMTSAFNLQRARELVQRAEPLDPELAMAQELFSDLAASQPNDPFLSLIRKEPIVLEEQTNGHKKPIETVNTLQYAAIEANGSQPSDEAVSADRLYNWNAKDTLSTLDTSTMQQAGSQAAPKATWSDDTNIEQVETWASSNPASQNHSVDNFETWATQQEIDDDFDPALLEQQPWFQAEQASMQAAEPVEQVQKDTQASSSKEPDAVRAPRKEEVPAPPAWLDMLTKTERRQPSGAIPKQPAHSEPPQEPAITAQPQAESVPSPRQSWEDELTMVPASPEQAEAVSPFFFAADDQDEDMGWPEWLKSLGAETIEPAAKTETQQPSPFSAWSDLQQSAQTPDPVQYESWTFQLQASSMTTQDSELANYSSWEAQIDQTMSEADRQQLATLENLEQSLLSQGFVPLQPGTLSAIAQESPASSTPELSSGTPAENLVEAARPTSPLAEPLPEQAQPLASSDTYTPPQMATPEVAATEMPAAPVVEPVATPTVFLPQEEPVLATNRVEPAINAAARQEALSIPAYRSDAFLENELETTMRRPAVRLQPMHTSATKTGHPYVVGKGRSTGDRSSESNLSNKERLLKGYQYQLAGSYDEAMQEYRLLIRNAPELIGDLISNVRALLKLAPKYTAGYRVLGDAYMRQGEYLQAMEAYNKALTMAKKAKGLSH